MWNVGRVYGRLSYKDAESIVRGEKTLQEFFDVPANAEIDTFGDEPDKQEFRISWSYPLHFKSWEQNKVLDLIAVSIEAAGANADG